MIRYPAHFVNKVRRLASENLTHKEIAQKLNISSSQVSIWCNGLSKGSHLSTIKTHQARRKILLSSGQKVFKNYEINNKVAKIFCGILYGCEGSKYPASSGVALVNADPELILSFLTLFRKSFKIKEVKLRAHLQIHDNQDYQKLISYWSSLLHIPKTQFYKPTITKPNGKKHRERYLGTCTIKYHDYRLQLQLIGIFEAFMRKSSLLGGVA